MNGRAEMNPLAGTLCLLLGASCIALAPIMVKLSPLGPQASAFWRLVIALPALAVWAALETRGRAADSGGAAEADAAAETRSGWRLMAIAGLLFAGDLATWHAGIVRTSAANATFLSNLTPLVVAAVAWMAGGERPGADWTRAVVLALTGSLLLSGGAPGLDSDRLTGDALSAATSLWYGFYLLAVARLRRDHGAGRIMLVSSAVAAAVCGTVAAWAGEPLLPPDDGSGDGAGNGPGALLTLAMWPLLVLGLVAHAGGQGLLAVGFGWTPARIASVIILWQPVLAAILGWLWLGEALGPVQAAGAALVLAGIWLARRAG